MATEVKDCCRKMELCCAFSSHLLENRFLETPVPVCTGEFTKGFRAGKLAEAGSTFSQPIYCCIELAFCQPSIKEIFNYFIAGNLGTISAITITLTGVLELE